MGFSDRRRVTTAPTLANVSVRAEANPRTPKVPGGDGLTPEEEEYDRGGREGQGRPEQEAGEGAVPPGHGRPR